MFQRLLSLFFRPSLEGRSPQWSKERADWLTSHPECEGCGCKEELQVHHIKPFAYYPELELTPTNYQTLCMKPGHECHYRIGHGMKGWNWYNPNSREDAKANRVMMNNCLNKRIG